MTWLYVPSACAPEVEGLTSASTSELSELASEALARCVWSRGKRSPARLWRQRWKREPWLRRLSGVTCTPSTLDGGVESWIASLAATHVSRFPSLVPARAQMTHDTYGQLSLVLYETPSQRSASLRMSPVICRSEHTTSSESFSEWATALRAHCGQRRKLALPTDESGCSSLLPTPSACSYGSNKGGAAGRTGKERHSLESMARKALWPTPTATLGTNGGAVTPAKAREGGTLIEALSARTTWPTPSGDGLATQVGGQLNPTWVEWLMGWPLGWTAYAYSGTASFQSRPPRRSSSSGTCSGAA